MSLDFVKIATSINYAMARGDKKLPEGCKMTIELDEPQWRECQEFAAEFMRLRLPERKPEGSSRTITEFSLYGITFKRRDHPARRAVLLRARKMFEDIRELNLLPPDGAGHRWANSDMIEQSVVLGLEAIGDLS